MESYLNEAAGFDGEDYSPYTRIIGIAWDGDHGRLNFWASEMAANRAGRRFAAVLRQLKEEDIKVNVITHSLGARVLLTALNLLGDSDGAPIDQAFLWQPAVEQYALSDADTHQGRLGHEAFPHAHRGVKRLVVLHSDGDGILNARLGNSNEGRPEDAQQDPIDTVLGYVAGAYAKKYWKESNPALSYLSRYFAYRAAEAPIHTETSADLRELRRIDREEAKPIVLAQLREEAETLNANPDATPHRLLPWAHFARFDEERLNWIADRILVLARRSVTGWAEEKRPLGWAFPDVEKGGLLAELVRDGALDDINQTGILYSHSGMRLPSQKLKEDIYERQIMMRIKEYAGFGRY
jgi:hypothetical protein